jgi:hypothetical protein
MTIHKILITGLCLSLLPLLALPIKAFASHDIVDGRLMMATAILTRTQTMKPSSDSPLTFQFESETNVFHEENKTIARPEVRSCSDIEADYFFDTVTERDVQSHLSRLRQQYPTMTLKVEVDYQLYQHDNFFHSRLSNVRLIIQNGPGGMISETLQLPHQPIINEACNCQLSDASVVESKVDTCRRPDYSRLVQRLRSL